MQVIQAWRRSDDKRFCVQVISWFADVCNPHSALMSSLKKHSFFSESTQNFQYRNDFLIFHILRLLYCEEGCAISHDIPRFPRIRCVRIYPRQLPYQEWKTPTNILISHWLFSILIWVNDEVWWRWFKGSGTTQSAKDEMIFCLVERIQCTVLSHRLRSNSTFAFIIICFSRNSKRHHI